MSAQLHTGTRPNTPKLTKSNRKMYATNVEITTGEGSQRNRPCHCGSNEKYKRCHMMIDKGLVKVMDANGSFHWEKGAAIQQVAHNISRAGHSLGTLIGGHQQK